jgi:hydrogenase-4 component B
VQHGAGTRDLERLGGLIKRMPRTAALVLIGSAAIAALPPLNGFAGEWLLFQSLLRLAIDDGSTGVALLAATGAAALALTGALAVAAFVRAYGITFLAQPKSDGAREAHECSRSMQAGMALLAACALAFGLGAPLLLSLIKPAVEGLAGSAPRPSILGTGALEVERLGGSYAPLAVAIVLGIAGLLPWAFARLAAGPAGRRIAPPWVCGFDIEPRMQYTATAFSKALRIIFQAAIRAERRIALDRPVSPYVVTAVRYEERVSPVYDRFFNRVVGGGLVDLARRVRPFQGGSVRAYLGYVLVTLVVAILLAR